jgi:hypothetical protein
LFAFSFLTEYEYTSLGDFMLHHTVFHLGDEAYDLVTYARRRFPTELIAPEDF